jgi:hypothetical protein
MCAQGITPGVRIVLSAGGIQYEIHTNLDGSNLAVVDRRVSVVVLDKDMTLQTVEIKSAFGEAEFSWMLSKLHQLVVAGAGQQKWSG